MWRGVSLRKLALLLFGPMLVETLAMLFNSWTALQADQRGYDPRSLLLIGFCGAVTYSASSFLAGRWVTPRLAPFMMIGSIVGVVAFACLAFYINQFWAFPVGTAVLGLLIGHYYVPFQISMSHVRPFRTLAWSIAFYNIAWGGGSSIGTFLGGSLKQASTFTLGSLAVVILIVHTLLNLLALSAPASSHDEHATADFASTRRQRLIIFLAFLSAGICFRGVLLTLWPSLQTQRHFSELNSAFGYFLLSVPIPLGALLWARLRHHLHEPWILLTALAVGSIGMLMLPLTESFALNAIAVFLIGTMESCAVYHAIYYANADRITHGKSVGIVEMLAGFGSIFGPAVLGLLAWDDAAALLPYLLAIAMLIATAAYTLKHRLTHGSL